MVMLVGQATKKKKKKRDLEIRHIMLKWSDAFLCSAVLAKYDHE